MIVEILGPDGVGKTTFARALSLALRDEGAKVVRYQYRSRVPLELDGSGEPCVQKLAGTRRRGPTALKCLGLYRTTLHRKNTFQIRERFFTDLELSPYRYRIAKQDLEVVRFFNLFLKKRHVRLLLVDDPEKIHRRKPELSVDEIAEVFEKFDVALGLSYHFDLQIQSTSDPPERSRQVDALVRFVLTLNDANWIPHRRRSIYVANGTAVREIWSRALVSSTSGKVWWGLANIAPKIRRPKSQFSVRKGAMTTFYKSHASRRIVILHSPVRRGARGHDPAAEFVQIIAGSPEEAKAERDILHLMADSDLPFDSLFRRQDQEPLALEIPNAKDVSPYSELAYELPNSLLFDYAPRVRDVTTEELAAALRALRTFRPDSILIHNDFTYWNFFASSNGPVLLDCGGSELAREWESTLEQESRDLFCYIASLAVKAKGSGAQSTVREMCEEVWTVVYRDPSDDASSRLLEAASLHARNFDLAGKPAFSSALRRIFGEIERVK